MSKGVVVLSFGHAQRFDPLLEELLASGLSAGDILVAHNPYSPEDSWTPSLPDGIRCVPLADNVGYSTAMNAGIQALDREWVLLLTHDSRATAEMVGGLFAATARADVAYGVLGPTMDMLLDPPIVSFGSDVCRGTVHHREEPPADVGGGIGDVDFVEGSAMLIRRKAWSAVGGLRPSYFMYFEEADFSERVRQAGWRTGVVLDVRFESEPGGLKRPGAYGFLYSRNGLEWFRRTQGTRAAGRFIAHQLGRAWADFPKPGGVRWREPEARRHYQLRSAGRVLGLAASVVGHRGKPPSYLLGSTDISAASSHAHTVAIR